MLCNEKKEKENKDILNEKFILKSDNNRIYYLNFKLSKEIYNIS